MTIICAYSDGESTWLGSDQLLTRGEQRTLLKGGKWAIHPSGWAAAMAGDELLSGILRTRIDDFCYNTDDPWLFLKRYRDLLPEYGVEMKRDSAGLPDLPGMLLARGGKLWEIDRAFSVVRWDTHRLLADGAAWQYAYGSSFGMEAEPVQIVRRAVMTANHFCQNTCEGLWLGKV